MEILKTSYRFKFKNSIFPKYLTNELNYSAAPIEEPDLMNIELIKSGTEIELEYSDYFDGLVKKGLIEGKVTLNDGYIAHYEITPYDIEEIKKVQLIEKVEIIHKNY